ncbi:hypothetical protein SCUCBS95973_004974 [Sporothrix curviconia]|uniref:Alpha/beta hydrolase fold-3 domain-containing protein n=1 Tax=Sporothrix curviconia TaxID=1260050 RepID=A0ABP0BT90_9PEZI
MDATQPARSARNATKKPSLLAKLATAGMIVALLPAILVLCLIRRARGQQKGIRFKEDLRRSVIRGATRLPLRFLEGRIPHADINVLLAAPRLKHFNRQLRLPVSDGLCSGYWVCKGPLGGSQIPRESDVVLLYYHGGAYCFGHPLESAMLLLRSIEIASAARNISISVFSARYTLALSGGGTFPLQQRQALAAYRHLLDVEKVPAEKIAGLPKPAGGLLLFPWTNLKSDSPSFRRNKHKDVLTKSLIDRCAGLVTGSKKGWNGTGDDTWAAHHDDDDDINWDELELVDLTRPLQQGKVRNWKDILPSFTWMNVGEHDMLFDDIHAFKRNAEADGARVDMDITPKMPHGWHAVDRPMVDMLLKLQPEDKIPAGKLPGSENVGAGLITVWDQAMRRK